MKPKIVAFCKRHDTNDPYTITNRQKIDRAVIFRIPTWVYNHL